MAALRWRGWNMLVSTPLRHTSSVFGGHRFFSSSSCGCSRLCQVPRKIHPSSSIERHDGGPATASRSCKRATTTMVS